MIWNIPNILTLLRLPLALLFIGASPEWRTVLLIIAGASDGADGFIARYFKQTTWVGTLLDPIMDKLFAVIIIGTFIVEGRLGVAECLVLFSRDIAVAIYGLFLWVQGGLAKYQVRAIWTGKLVTCLQFLVFLLLVWNVEVPVWLYVVVGLVGCAALAELIAREVPSS